MATNQNSNIGTVKPFDGNGFSNWEFRLKLLLEHYDVLDVLTQEPPTEDEIRLASLKKKRI